MPTSSSTTQQHVASDQTILFVDRYAPIAAASATLLIVHGYLEHAGRYARVARALASRGIDCSVLELRGHGRSGGPRAHVNLFSRYVDDVIEVLAAQRKAGGPGAPFVLGHSLGGLIVSHLAQSHSSSLGGVLLSNPYLANAVPISTGKRWLGRVAHRLAPRLRAPAGLKREWMSRDPAALEAMVQDQRIQRFATAGWFHQVTLAQEAVAKFRKWDCPVWVGIGEADPVASPVASRRFAERLLAPEKRIVTYPGALHELLQDTVAPQVHEDLIAWLLAVQPNSAA